MSLGRYSVVAAVMMVAATAESKRASLVVDLPGQVERGEPETSDPYWGPGHGEWSWVRSGGVTRRLRKFQPTRPAEGKRLGRLLARWRKDHGCSAKESAGFPPVRWGSESVPQLTFEGSCKGGERYIICVLVVDGMVYELHVDSPASGASEDQLRVELAKYVASARFADVDQE